MVLNTSLIVQEPIVRRHQSKRCGLLSPSSGPDALLLMTSVVVASPSLRFAEAPAAALRFEPIAGSFWHAVAFAGVRQRSQKDGVCPFYRRNECSHRDIGAGEEKAATADPSARAGTFAHHYRRASCAA